MYCLNFYACRGLWPKSDFQIKTWNLKLDYLSTLRLKLHYIGQTNFLVKFSLTASIDSIQCQNIKLISTEHINAVVISEQVWPWKIWNSQSALTHCHWARQYLSGTKYFEQHCSKHWLSASLASTHINSSPPSAAYMCQWIGSVVVQIMACRLFSAKTLPQPILGYCQLDP